jgi:hypothetical protein
LGLAEPIINKALCFRIIVYPSKSEASRIKRFRNPHSCVASFPDIAVAQGAYTDPTHENGQRIEIESNRRVSVLGGLPQDSSRTTHRVQHY